MTEVDISKAEERRAMWAHIVPFAAHIVPFVAWIGLMSILPQTAWAYALRVAISVGLLVTLRPWRWYARFQVRHAVPALLVGVGVFAIWVLPESPLAARWPGLQALYLKVGTMPPWKSFEPATVTPYAPEVCGWPLAIVRLLGSALVIAVIEEYFWRGFVYRWAAGKNFLDVDLGTFQLPIFLLVGLLFGLEHQRWLVGFLAGLAYGGLVIKTRDLGAACAAHVVTNLLLGFYVLATGAYAFW